MKQLSNSAKYKIMETMIDVANVLGIGKEQSIKINKCIDQMIVTGKIRIIDMYTLGSMVPGIIDIMAYSMNLSIANFYKMIRLGEIYSYDALPKFKEELKKVFNLQNTAKNGHRKIN